MRTVNEVNENQKKLATYSQAKKVSNVPLPADMGDVSSAEMTQVFKLMSLIKSGTTTNWETVRDTFVRNKLSVPKEKQLENLIANLVSKAKAKNISQEDIIMNDMNLDTNDVISQIQDGTVDVDAGEKELEKMAMLEGDMPGQGKSKEGNWRPV
jgi:hypothetical protein